MRYANMFKVPELRRRLFFTIGLIAVYRIGIFVSIPGMDRNVMREWVSSGSSGFLGLFNLFSGGALEQASIFALNIMPYVTASIIISLMTAVYKPLEELKKEGESGQRKINQYTRYGTVALALFQSFLLARTFEGQETQVGDLVRNPGIGFQLMAALTLTTGTAFLMWLGEQITERGVGNGISLIIFAGIVANLPQAIMQTSELVGFGKIQPIDLLVIGTIALGVIAIIVFFERAQRRLPIHYAKRTVGKQVYGQQASHLPLKVNMSGVIPPIFASSLLMFVGTLRQWLGESFVEKWGRHWYTSILDSVFDMLTSPSHWAYIVVFAAMNIFFCFFYTAVTFQPVDVAENLKKQNAFIPGIRPGKATAEYIDNVVTRITVGGSLYVAAVCTIPTLMQSSYQVPFYLGGTSLMIVVGVALDFVQQIDAYLITRHYESLTGPSQGPLRSRKKPAAA